MEVTSRAVGEVLEVVVSGRLDATWAPRLESELAERVRAGAHRLRLDLAAVGYLSSAGIRVLLMAAKQLAAIGGGLTIGEASGHVRSVLELSGLEELLSSSHPAATPAPAGAGVLSPTRIERPGLVLDVFRKGDPGPLRCELVGEPELARPGRAADVELPAGVMAVGIGALGGGDDDPRGRFGELLAAGGVATFAPTDGADRPDYVVSTGRLVPRAHLECGVVCRGALPLLIRFEADAGSPATLRTLVEELLALAGPVAAMAMLAESDGLVGATLKRSPATAAGESPFAFPGIRDWLSYTPERQHRRALALVAGVAAEAADPRLGRFARPLGEHGPYAHLHAAALPFAPMARGALELESTLARLLEATAPLAVLHLLCDDRELVGGGDSAFLRGAAWVGAVDEVRRAPS